MCPCLKDHIFTYYKSLKCFCLLLHVVPVRFRFFHPAFQSLSRARTHSRPTAGQSSITSRSPQSELPFLFPLTTSSALLRRTYFSTFPLHLPPPWTTPEPPLSPRDRAFADRVPNFSLNFTVCRHLPRVHSEWEHVLPPTSPPPGYRSAAALLASPLPPLASLKEERRTEGGRSREREIKKNTDRWVSGQCIFSKFHPSFFSPFFLLLFFPFFFFFSVCFFSFLSVRFFLSVYFFLSFCLFFALFLFFLILCLSSIYLFRCYFIGLFSLLFLSTFFKTFFRRLFSGFFHPLFSSTEFNGRIDFGMYGHEIIFRWLKMAIDYASWIYITGDR